MFRKLEFALVTERLSFGEWHTATTGCQLESRGRNGVVLTATAVANSCLGHGRAYMAGEANADPDRVASVLKHFFASHGRVEISTHWSLPTIAPAVDELVRQYAEEGVLAGETVPAAEVAHELMRLELEGVTMTQPSVVDAAG